MFTSSISWSRHHSIGINKENRIVEGIVVGRVPTHLFRQRVNIHPPSQSRVIIPRTEVVGVNIKLILIFLPAKLILIRIAHIRHSRYRKDLPRQTSSRASGGNHHTHSYCWVLLDCSENPSDLYDIVKQLF